jgi:Protein of unknown function (DUF3551)
VTNKIKIAFLGALLVATVSAVSAQAFNGSQDNDTDTYCVQIQGNASNLRCAYETLGACQEATNSGEGTCVENPKSRWDLR